RMVEEHAVAHLHAVAHEVARLVVAHAEPRGGLFRSAGEVVDRELVRLALHQPVGHRGREAQIPCGVRPGRTLEPSGSSRSPTGHRRYVRRGTRTIAPLASVHGNKLIGSKDVSLDEHRRKPQKSFSWSAARAASTVSCIAVILRRIAVPSTAFAPPPP